MATWVGSDTVDLDVVSGTTSAEVEGGSFHYEPMPPIRMPDFFFTHEDLAKATITPDSEEEDYRFM